VGGAAGSGAREIAVCSDGEFSPLWELSSLGEAAMGSLRCTWQTAPPASRASPAPTGSAFQIWERHRSNVGVVELWRGCDGLA
jgi:hypothetical protein